jgi:5-methylthioadenosine/S-adenosylhomocysteine deaminase
MPAESADLLIAPRWLLPIAPDNTVLSDHAVAVRDGRIIAVGPTALLEQRFRPGEFIARPRHALLPGLVNAHNTGALTALRGLPVSAPRARWQRETLEPALQRWSGPDLVRDGLLLGMAQMLRAGITTFADVSGFPEEAARVAAQTHMRAAIGLPVADAPSQWADSATAYLAHAERLWDSYRANPRLCLYFAPQNPNEISDDTLVRVRRITDELDARVAMSVHESELMVQDCLSRHGRRPLQRLEDLGLLRPGFTAIHMTRLLPNDCALAARSAIQVVACTHSDLRLGSGCCPLTALQDAAVTVGFGSADALSAGGFDLLAQARTASLLGSGLSGGTEQLSAPDALRMATLGGAQALGFAHVTGSIESGKMADLLCLDLGPRADQLTHVPEQILFNSSEHRVADVWTSGRAALSGGELLGFDPEELDSIARQWAQRTAEVA